MNRRTRITLFVTYSFIAGCTVLPLGPEVQVTLITPTTAMQIPTAQPPLFKIATDKGGDDLSVSNAGETAIFDVRSQSGIGSATIELVAGTAPRKILVRLHLSGLEEFRLLYENTVIAVSISNRDIGSVSERSISPDGKEEPIEPDSPLWMDTRVVPDQEYFEITLPEDLLNDGRRSFSMRWIDFYR